MDQKLTIKLNGEIIEEAKEYAHRHNQSLSRIVESYLKTLVQNEAGTKKKKKFIITPFVKSICTGVVIPDELDVKEAYKTHLADKYK